MSEGAAKAKTVREIAEEARSRTSTRTTTTTRKADKVQENTKFANIESNPFFKIALSSELSPQQKATAITELKTVDLTKSKEENQEKIKEFDVFKEWLQEQRKTLAQEVISLTDTETMSELKAVIDELQQGLTDFEKQIDPLTKILDAVYELRQAGGETVMGVFREIKQDQEAEAERLRQIAETEAAIKDLKSTVSGTFADIEVMKTSSKNKKFFGLGGLKEDAIRQITLKEQELSEAKEKAAAEAAKLAELNDASKTRESKYAEFIEQKAQLRELLDISSEEHRNRQKQLVGAAQNFVNSSDQRVGSVLGHLEKMTTQVDTVYNANHGMRAIYSILNDATKTAEQKNEEIRQSLGAKEGVETEIEKMDRESKQAFVEDYISSLNSSSRETVQTLGELTMQATRIKSMRDANREQVSNARQMHPSGIATVADQLAMTLQAVSAAGLNEASEHAKLAIQSMNDKTNQVAAKEVMRTAMGMEEVAVNLERTVDELAQNRELMQAATSITRENMKRIREGLDKVKETADDLEGSIKESRGVAADTIADHTPSNDDKKETKKKVDGSTLGKLTGF